MLVTITVDGSVLKNPGIGGWCAVFRVPGHCKALFGFEGLQTTNNRMELTAAISALEHLKYPCEVNLTSDSEYVIKGMTLWIHKWKRNGWKALKYDPFKKEYNGVKDVVNQDLWQELDLAQSVHRVKWIHVKGHDTHEDNIRCDLIAREAARRQIQGIRDLPDTPIQEKLKPMIPEDITRCITFD